MGNQEFERKMYERRGELRQVFKQYSPGELFFPGDEKKLRDGTIIHPADDLLTRGYHNMELNPTDIVIPHYDNLDVMTIEFFAELALRFGMNEVSKFVCGTRQESQPAYMTGASHLIYGGFIWALAFLYASKHGFRFENIYSDAYVNAYNKVFSFAFSEYDDFLRDRISRRQLCHDLTRWDSRIENEYQDNYVDEEKRTQFDENSLSLIDQIHKQKEDYPFEGKIGYFVNGLGYIALNENYPYFTKIKDWFYGENEKDERPQEVQAATFEYHNLAYKLFHYLHENNIGKEFNIEGIKFLKIDTENHTLELLDTIKSATLEEIEEDKAKILDFMTPKNPVEGGKENVDA